MKRNAMTAALLLAAILMSGCMDRGNEPQTWRLNQQSASAPALPESLAIDEDGLPVLSVYDVKAKELTDMDVETYVAGVVAGEMKNDWPEEALKAQAILTRTFVMKFCADKKSKYDGADISTDVSEAQAYAPESVNARVEQAVSATRGQVLVYQGDFINAWFHAHSGGMTELPSVALDYRGGDPEYLTPTASEESDKAPESARRWTATFTTDQGRAACADAGVKGVVCFGVGLTLREGDREYYYAALDRHFPGLKERYIRTYGNAYDLPSPNAPALEKLFHRFCAEHSMLHTPEDCFAYMRELPEKNEQLSLF